jgi:uncharacterized repeat protein (TIGR01451 family)
MNQPVTKLGFLAIVLVLLAAATTTLPRAIAVPPAAVTGTPTEQPTRTPTNTPNNPIPTPTNTPRPSKPGLADPLITKAVNVAEARIGDEVTFTIKVTNKGNDFAEDVVVTDPLPDYLDVIEATTTRGNVSSSGRTVIVDIGRVAPGEEITIRIRVRVNERAQPPEGRNGVTLVTSSPSDDPRNNTSQVTFRIVGDATPTLTTLPATPQPTATAVPVPRRLPRTGGGDGSGGLVALATLAGLLGLGGSLLLRRRLRR